jgi:DNA-binding IclR family transcriptional regulator
VGASGTGSEETYDSTHERAPGGLLSARRVVALLLAFTREHHTLAARELAAATSLPLPSVYRYLALLKDVGLLLEHGGGRYRLSGKVFGLAEAARAAEPLLEAADPVMRRLAARTGEAVVLFQLVGGQAVCVHRIESERLLRVSFPPGRTLPLDKGASSRILLAGLSEADQAAAIAELSHGDEARAAALAEAVKEAGQRGWAMGDQEIDEGIWVAAAAVRSDAGTLACLSVPSPSVRARPEDQAHLLRLVRDAAGAIGQALRAVASG